MAPWDANLICKVALQFSVKYITTETSCTCFHSSPRLDSICRQFNSFSESTASCSPYTRFRPTAAAHPSPLQAAPVRRRRCRAEPGSRGSTQAGARGASPHHQSAHAGGWRLWRCNSGTGATAGGSNAQVRTIVPIVTDKFAFHQNTTGRHHSEHGHAHAISLLVLVLEV